MLKRILNFMQKNFTTCRRNNMVIYILLFPIILAIGMNFFMPSLTETAVTIAVEKNVGQQFINKLDNYGEIELYNTPKEVKERVNKVDDISGIIKKDNEFVVLLEGNEPKSAEEMARAVMGHILNPAKNTTFKQKTLNKKSNMMTETGGSLLLLNAILIAGLVVGFNIIEEKETKSIRALSVSPLRLPEFIASHTLFTIILGIILAVIPSFILVGTSINYWQVILGTLCTIGVGLSWGILIGAYSDNLISAIALIKGSMLFMIGVPIGSIFVPTTIKWIFYPFPNYWAFQVYLNIFNGNTQWINFTNSCLITLGFSSLIMMIMTPLLRKRLNIR